MKVLRMLLAGSFLIATTGCSQMVQVPQNQAASLGTLKDAHVRTKTGEVYQFDLASVRGDSLSGYANEERTVFLEGGEIQTVEEQKAVHLAFADIEELTVKKRNWKRAGLWTLAAGAVAGGLAIASGQNSPPSADANSSGGGKGGGPTP
ncbi:MAG TPA: hypothetical protein VGR66_08780 [Candidatus Eisenbacteria bacterium]|nr:hypothetical protein [Candidatus Eisenbacteria bacterium]